MATLIGVVSKVIGEVFAVAGNGTRRPLVEGDRVYAGEQLVTGASGAVAIALVGGGELTLGRDSSLMLDTQLLAGARGEGSAAAAQGAESAPSDQDLAEVEQLQAAIEAGEDPTASLAAPAAGPGTGAAGNAGGGHSFVLLGETAGALDPVIGFPTEGLSFVPEFPDPDIEADIEVTVEEPDSSPAVEVVYDDPSIDAGVGTVDEAALPGGSNPDSPNETTSGQLLITSPDGISSVQVQLQAQNIAGEWIDITNGGVVEGQYGILSFDSAGNWVYTITTNTLDHAIPDATGAADQVAETFAIRVIDNDGDVSPVAPLIIQINDDGPMAVNDFASTAEDTAIVYNVISNGDGTSDTPGADQSTTLTNATLVTVGAGLVSFAANGEITFTPTAGFEGAVTIHYTITDGDLDSSEADLVITVAPDSVPTLNIVTADGGALVDEEALSDGSNPDSTAESTSGSFNIDTQGDSLASLVINGIDVTAGGTVIGSYGTLQVFADHSWTYTLTDNTLDHDEVDVTGAGDQVFDDFNVVVTDSDGDSDDGVLSVAINDDGPTAFYPDGIHVVLGVEDPTPITVTKSLNFLANAGADGVGSIAFSIEDGQAFVDQDGKQLYLDNEELFLFYDGDSQHIEARTLDGDIAFSAEIDGNGDMSITMFSGSFISNTQITSVTDLSGIGGGNVPFKGLNIGSKQVPDPDGSDDVLVSSEILPLNDGDASTVNSNANELGVGQGNEVSDGEVIRYDLVTGLSINDQKNSESYSFDGYQQTFAFRQKLVVSGGSKDADFKLRIYDASGSATGANTSLVGTTATAQLVLLVSEIVIYDANGNVQNNVDHVAQDGDGVILYNLGDGWTFEIVSVDQFGEPQAFNAVEIEAIESTNGTVGSDGATTSFKLGEFSFGQATDLDPVTFSLPVTGTDGDGDSLSSAIDVTVYPDSKSIEGTEASDTGINSLVGDGGENYIFGYGGNDTLVGNGGDDILLGGLGDDSMSGGAGADIFRWQAGESGHDVVTDFELGVDSLDLSDLLVGEEVNPLDQYLNFSFSVTATTIEASAEAGGSVVQTIELQNVTEGDLIAQYGGSDAATLITGMLGDGSLVVDTV